MQQQEQVVSGVTDVRCQTQRYLSRPILTMYQYRIENEEGITFWVSKPWRWVIMITADDRAGGAEGALTAQQ